MRQAAVELERDRECDGEREVAHGCVVLGAMRGGYRVLHLCDNKGTRIDLCGLLLRIEHGVQPAEKLSAAFASEQAQRDGVATALNVREARLARWKQTRSELRGVAKALDVKLMCAAMEATAACSVATAAMEAMAASSAATVALVARAVLARDLLPEAATLPRRLPRRLPRHLPRHLPRLHPPRRTHRGRRR